MLRVAKPLRIFLGAGAVLILAVAGGDPARAQFGWQSSPEQTIENWVRALVERARAAARFGVTGEERKEAAKPEPKEPETPTAVVAGISEKSAVPKVSDVVLLPENGSRFAGIGEPGDIVAIKSNGEVLAVTTVAQSGQWSVVVNSQLEPGDHLISAAVRDGGGAHVVVGDEVRIRIPSGYFQDRPGAFGRLAARQRQDATARFSEQARPPPLPLRKPPNGVRMPPPGKLAQGAPPPQAESPPAPPARRPLPGVRPGASDEWLAWGFEWLERSGQAYNDGIVEKLQQGGPGRAATPAPEERAAGNKTPAPAAPPGPGRSFEFMSFVDAVQDWLAKAQRDYQNEVAEKLTQPADGGVARGKADATGEREKERAAEALRKAEIDRARAEAQRAGEKAAETATQAEARRRAEAARKLAEVERLAVEDKRKREAAAQQAEAARLQEAEKRKADERARQLAAKSEADAREKALREQAAAKAREEEARRKAAEVERQRAADAKRKAEADELARQQAAEVKRKTEAEAAEAARKTAAAEAEARRRQQSAMKDAAREAERAKEAAARAAVAALKAEEAAKQAEEQRERDRQALREAEAALAQARRERQSSALRAAAQRKAREEARKADERRALAEIARRVARERDAAKARATREAEAAVAAMRRAEAARAAQDAAASQVAKDRARARAESNARQAMEAAKRALAEEKAGEERARVLEKQLLAERQAVAKDARGQAARRKEIAAELKRNPPPVPRKAPSRSERSPLARAPQTLPRKAPARDVAQPAAKAPVDGAKQIQRDRVADVPKPPPSPYRSRTPKFAQEGRSSLGARRAIYRPKRKRRMRKRRVAYRPTCARAGRGVSVPGMYVVRRGDTLWAIARRHYGRGIRYHAIYRANKGKIRDPHWIYPCQKFWLPKLRNN